MSYKILKWLSVVAVAEDSAGEAAAVAGSEAEGAEEVSAEVEAAEAIAEGNEKFIIIILASRNKKLI